MQEDTRKNNKFLPGFFAGILVTLGIGMIVVGGFFILAKNSGKLSMLYTGAIPGTGDTEVTDGIDWDGISQKSQSIAEVLEQLYMGDFDADTMEQYIYKGIFASLNARDLQKKQAFRLFIKKGLTKYPKKGIMKFGKNVRTNQ